MNRFDRNSLEDSIANSLTNVINIMGFNPEAVAERLKFQHRALQEDFTRICMEWLKVVASPDTLMMLVMNVLTLLPSKCFILQNMW